MIIVDHFIKNCIMTLPFLYVLTCLRYVRKNIINFRTHSQIHSYTTRNNVNLYKNKCKYSTTQHSFEYNSVIFFNLLPLDIRNLSLPTFKRTVGPTAQTFD